MENDDESKKQIPSRHGSIAVGSDTNEDQETSGQYLTPDSTTPGMDSPDSLDAYAGPLEYTALNRGRSNVDSAPQRPRGSTEHLGPPPSYEEALQRNRKKPDNDPSNTARPEHLELQDYTGRKPVPNNDSLSEDPDERYQSAATALNGSRSVMTPLDPGHIELSDYRVENEASGGPQATLATPEVVSADTSPRNEASTDVEAAPGDRSRCEECGGPYPFVWRYMMCCCHKYVDESFVQRHINKIVIGIILLLGLFLFLTLFPVSFVYIEYDELALEKSRITNEVDHVTRYPGCYVANPDTVMRRFPKSAHFVEMKDIPFFTADRLKVGFSCAFQYFIKPEELYQLHEKFELDYAPVVELVADTTLKIEATKFTLDHFRLNRSVVENELHMAVKRRLEGNCCPECCQKGYQCENRVNCSSCQPQPNCYQGYHINVPYFQLLEIDVPTDVSSKFLTRTVLKIDAEAEKFVQESVLIEKETVRQEEAISNQAREVSAEAEAIANKLVKIAQAEANAITQNATIHGLKQLYAKLGINNEDHKMSLFLLHSLRQSDNIYMSPGFEKETLWGV